MWCPSVSLTLWTNAWLAGQAAPDDVLDALSQWAPRHSVTAYDGVAAQRTGLPWPDVNDAGAVSLLQTVRTAAGRPTVPGPALGIVLPVPGDVRGLPPGTTFGRDAVAAGEAVLVRAERDAPIGLVPEFQDDDSHPEFAHSDTGVLSWTVYSLPSVPAAVPTDLGGGSRSSTSPTTRCGSRATSRSATCTPPPSGSPA